MRDVVKVVVGAAIAVLLFVWVFHGVGRDALLDALRSATVGGLVLSAALQYGHNVFRVARWRLLLAPVRPGVPFRPMITAVTLGYLVTWTIPGRLGELVRPALRIGRDHISSTVNTLFLAYAGAALPLLLFFTEAGQSVRGVVTRELVATEVVRALVGSIGLVASVPIATWLAAVVVSGPESAVDVIDDDGAELGDQGLAEG